MMKPIIACTLLLAGCASGPGLTTASTQSPPPQDYRPMVKERVMATFKDPYSIRDATISTPKWDGTPLPLPSGMWAMGVWAVCVRANAKNGFGAYGGAEYTAFVFIDGKIDSVLQNPRWDAFCSDTQMQPFPEIMQKA